MKVAALLSGMVLCGASFTAWAEPLKVEAAVPANGVFVTYGYHNTVLELKDGKFRYWFSSDAKLAGDETKYPLEGTYSTEGDKISLKHEKIYPPQVDWTAKSVGGVLTLWRSDALKNLAEGKLEFSSEEKTRFFVHGGGSIIVPTKRTAEEAWKTPPVRTLTGSEAPKGEKSAEGDPPAAAPPADSKKD